MSLEQKEIEICQEDNLKITKKSVDAEVCSNTDLEISGKKKEYSIVGDSLYASITSEQAPQWLISIIDDVVNSLLGTRINDLNRAIDSINKSLLELDVAKNQYQELVNIDSRIDSVLASRLQTLNATIQQNAANIVELDMAKVTPNEALAISIDHVNAQINNGKIHSLVTELNSSIANNEIAAANHIKSLESVYDENESKVRSILSTSTGEYTATTNALTELEVNLNEELYGAAGLENTLKAEISDEGKRVESKFAYNSSIGINGKFYKSGFGLSALTTSGGTGTEANPYNSEFWINAQKFKFTNDNMTGQVSPFTIDASGTTPQITFNGKVSFTNLTNVPVVNKTFVQTNQPASGMNKGDTWIDTDDRNTLYTYNGSTWVKTQSGAKNYLQPSAPTSGMVDGDMWIDSDDNYKQYRYNGSTWVAIAYNAATDINNNTTTIDGGKITTGSLSANKLSSTNGLSTVWTGGGLISSNFNGSVIGNIGNPTQGFRLSSNAAGTSTDPNIYGAYIKASSIESLYSPVPGTSNYGNFNFSAYAAGGGSVSVVGPNYSTGYLKNRLTSLTNSNLVVKGFVNISTGEVGKWDISGYLQRSINSQTYTTIQTKRMYFNLPPQTATGSDFYYVHVNISISVWVDGKLGTGSGRDYDSGTVSISITIAPKMAMTTTLEFYYIEDLSAIGSFNTLNYKIPNGTVYLTLNN